MGVGLESFIDTFFGEWIEGDCFVGRIVRGWELRLFHVEGLEVSGWRVKGSGQFARFLLGYH